MNREFRLFCSLVALVLMSACSSKGSVDIGHGQTSGGATDFGIAYIKRTLPTDPADLQTMRDLDDLTHQRPFWSKADVYIRDKATPSGTERNITTRVTGTDFYDIRDLEVSADGTKLLFAMRGPIDPQMKDFDTPTWRIWEYDIAADDLHSLTDDVTADEGEDVSPHYLPLDTSHPNGRILIASTRQRYSKGVLLIEGKSGFEAQTENRDESAFTLNVLDPTLTGPSAFQQISFNQSHDLNPTVLRGGRIMYTRWDHAPGGTNAMHLYTMNPDGTDVELLYGAHSHLVGSVDPATNLPSDVQFVKAREMEDGHVLALTRPMDAGTDFGGNLVILDVVNSVECNQRTIAAGASSSSSSCPAMAATTPNDVRTIPGPSPGGRFNSAYPLWDSTHRVLTSWTECRLIDSTGATVPCTSANLAVMPALPIAPPLYSAWLFNPTDNTFKPIVAPTEGVMLTDIVSLQTRPVPAYVPPVATGTTLAGDGFGIIDIRSIYDWADATVPLANGGETNAEVIARMSVTPADSRVARFLRIEKAVSIGDKDLNDGFPDFDRNISLDNSVGFMREILGYVPIEADGSVRVKVPSNVAFQISVIDADARRLPQFPQHRQWLQLRPGEVLQCNGCHNARTATSTTSHGRGGLFAPANAGDAANNGATMAQATYGALTNCGGTVACNAATPSLNVIYAGTVAPDSPISLTYSPGLTTAMPTSTSCNNSYSSACRITVDYAASGTGATTILPAHIDPLWSVDRAANTCTTCHTATRTQDVTCTPAPTPGMTDPPTPVTVTLQVAADGGLELDADPAQQVTAQLRAYQQLVSTHTTSSFSLDAACAPVRTDTQVSGSIASGSAAGSRFFRVLSGTPAAPVNHSGYLSPAELRLLSEWVDIGAQYYNNPFAAPLNN
ncbi:MAG: hypothetical protein ACRES2_05640 [Steroidobacteraceae bacterium]